MERRFFLAILLSFVVLYGYQALFVPPTPKAPQSATTPASPANGAPTSPSSAASAAASPATQPAPDAPPAEGEASEREIVVDTATVQVVLSSRGGRVIHWRLKAFRD